MSNYETYQKSLEDLQEAWDNFTEVFYTEIAQPLLEGFSIMLDNISKQLKQPEEEPLPQAAEEDSNVSMRIIPYEDD